MNFINAFGTHYVSKANFGSMQFNNTLFSESFFDLAAFSTGSTSVSFGYSSDDIQAGLSAAHAHNDTSKEAKAFAKKMHHNITIGVNPSGMDENTWKEQSYVYAAPVEYWLNPIYEFFEYNYVCEVYWP